MSARRQHIEAVAAQDHRHSASGVPVVGSLRALPVTERKWIVNGRADTGKTARWVHVALTTEEAQQLVKDWTSMGLMK